MSYSQTEDRIDFPARSASSITPNDSTIFNQPTKGLYVGGAGNLNVVFMDDTAAVVITGVQAGTVLPFRVKQVKSTSTTATAIVGLY